MGSEATEHTNVTEAHDSPFLGSLFEPVLVTVMIICIGISMKNLILTIYPPWNGAPYLVGMILVTIEAISSHRIIRRHRHLREKWYRFRLAEWIGILLCMKALTYLNKPCGVTFADIQRWLMEPIHFLSVEFMTYSLSALVIWHITIHTLKAFDAVYDPFLGVSRSTDPLQALIHRFYLGGVMIILISGLAQFFFRTGMKALMDLAHPMIKEDFFNVLAYFILGLILLSRTHLNLQLLQWRREKIDISHHLTRRWAKYGFLVLAIIVPIAFTLPTRYTTDFLTSIKILLLYGLKGIIYSFKFILDIFVFCLEWVLSFFSFKEEIVEEISKGRPIPPVQDTIDASPSDIVPSFIFWIIVLAIMVYFLRIYFKDHPGFLNWIKPIRFRYPWLVWLNKLWQWLKGNVQSAIHFIPEIIILHSKTKEASARTKRKWLRLSALSAREKILYYYLSTLRRAAKYGVNRQKDQTPNEYAPRLYQSMPDMDKEIQLLTETFIHARYSLDTFDHEQASLVKTTWRQIRRVLRKKRK
jgi:hypothetical protein